MIAYLQRSPASQIVTSQLSLLRLMLDISWQSFISLISSAKAARISSNSSRLRVWNFGKRATCNKGNVDLVTTPPWVSLSFKDVNSLSNSEPGIKQKLILCQQVFLNVLYGKTHDRYDYTKLMTALAQWWWEKWTKIFREKTVPVRLCPPQTPHGMPWHQTGVSLNMQQQVSAWTIALPTSKQKTQQHNETLT